MVWVLIIAHNVQLRSRDIDFPKNARVYVDSHEQPATMPHADVSRGGAVTELRHVFPGQEKYWRGKDYDIIK